ncbi:hypothetical protein [Methylobacterium oxalidis]|uniref:hypothetical protein n=1 Tax=Methylobacterium oxalidis TaxID=944322 RepID=UPI001EDEC203|nr:hypothetical protein [Methylobacterium oxalidis]
MIQGGWIKPSREESPSWQLFDAIASKPLLENVKSSMTWKQVMRFIDAPKAHREIMLKAGFIAHRRGLAGLRARGPRGTARAFATNPAVQALLPTLVPRDLIGPAIGPRCH